MCVPKYDDDGYKLVGKYRVSEDADLLPEHRVCQVCKDGRFVLAPATHLAPRREGEDSYDLEARIIYLPVCASHAASWLLDCEGLALGPMMQMPVADVTTGHG